MTRNWKKKELKATLIPTNVNATNKETSLVPLSAGVILSSVVSPDPSISPFLLVLDARSMKEVARASIDASVHMDLHGLFIPAVP